MSVNQREKERGAEKIEREQDKSDLAIERKIERKTSFYAKTSEIERAMFLK